MHEQPAVTLPIHTGDARYASPSPAGASIIARRRGDY
jgi:hypothetical protein